MEAPFLHIEVKNWSLSIYKELLLVLAQVMNTYKDRPEIYTLIAKNKGQTKKFAELFGFNELAEYEDTYFMGRST